MQPAFDQAVDWVRTRIGDGADLEARVMVAMSALLYLRISEFTYGSTPAGVNRDAFLAVVERIFEGNPG